MHVNLELLDLLHQCPIQRDRDGGGRRVNRGDRVQGNVFVHAAVNCVDVLLFSSCWRSCCDPSQVQGRLECLQIRHVDGVSS